MPMVEDLSLFFNADELAHQAVLDNVVVAGIFDNGYELALGAIGVQRPTFTLPTAACSNIEPGTSHLRIPGVGSYSVQEVEPDGTGVSTLRLQLLQVEAA